jgi:hypothetical protein
MTDSFLLLIKAYSLFPRVVNFNIRTPANVEDLLMLREGRAFKTLEHATWELGSSWPKEFIEPLSTEKPFDVVLYYASIVRLG